MDILILVTSVVEKCVLLSLLGLSIWSIAIIIDRRRALKGEGQFDFVGLKSTLVARDWRRARELCSANAGIVASSLGAALSTMGSPEQIDRAVASQYKEERMQLEKGLAVLATLGANAPFIGLFGTVLGIIRAFAYLGAQSGSSSVMSGVSQALYATAAGLFVAIPAVVAFNTFSKKLKDLQMQVESLKDLYISRLPGE